MSVRTDVINLNVNVNGNKAQNDLNQLRKKAADVRFEMDGLKKGTAEYIAKKKELAGITEEMARLKKQIGITALTQKELVKELNSMKALKASMQPFTEEWKKLDKEIKKVENRLYDVKNGVQGFSSFFSKIKDEVKQFGTVAAAYLGFQFLTNQFRNIINGAAKMSDQIADIRRVTGLTAFEVENLNSQLSRLDTRTSTSGLREIAIIAGKLGVAKNDILGFTVAVDKLVVALGDELGNADQITTELGKILNVFDGQVTGENITYLGNAIVDLANKGVASGGFIVDFTQRLAGLAGTANLTLDAAIGLAAALEETGQRTESSSTAIINLLGQLGNDVDTFAKAAGKDVKEFAKTIEERPVEALLQLAEGVVKNKKGLQELSPAFKNLGIDGVRVQTVLGVLGTKSDFFRQKISEAGGALKQTSAITDAFNLKNQTFGAELEKLGKTLNRIFINSGVVSFFKDVVSGLNSILTPAKSAIQKFEELNEEVQNLDKNILPLANRYDELKRKTSLSKDEQNEMKSIIEQITAVIPSAVTQFDEYGNAIAISTDRVREFIDTEKARLKVVNAAAIDEYNKKLVRIDKQIATTKKQVDEIAKRGTIELSTEITTVGSGDIPSFTEVRKASQKEIGAIQEKYRTLLDQKKGYEAEVKRLNGDALQAQLDAQEKAAEAARIAREKARAEAESNTGSGSSTSNKDLNSLQRDAEAFAEEIKRLQREVEINGMDLDAQEVARIEDKYAELLIRARKYSFDLLTIRKLEQKELEQLFDKMLEKQLEKQRQAEEKRAKEEDEASKKAIDRRFANDQKRIEALTKANSKKGKSDQSEEEKEKKALAERIRNVIEYANVFQDVMNSLSRYATAREENLLAKDRKANDEKKKNLKKQLDAKLLSEAQYNIKVAQLDEELAAKEREIRRQQAKREKALNIFQSIVNTASAVAEALPNIPLSIAVGIAGAIQTALIASTPLPELGTGGWIKKGDKHSAPSKGIPALIERDEAVMSAAAMTDKKVYNVIGNTAQITSALNGRNGGANWAGGAKVVEMPGWRTAAAAQINPGLPTILEQGGIVRSLDGVSNGNNGMVEKLLQQLVIETQRTTEEIKTMKTKLKAIVSIKELREEEKLYDASKKASGLNG